MTIGFTGLLELSGVWLSRPPIITTTLDLGIEVVVYNPTIEVTVYNPDIEVTT